MARKSKKELVKECQKIIDDKMTALPITMRKKAYLELEKWANEELSEGAREIFLEALYSAKSTQDTRMLLSVERALGKLEVK